MAGRSHRGNEPGDNSEGRLGAGSATAARLLYRFHRRRLDWHK